MKRNFSNIDFVVSEKISYEEYLNKGVNYWNAYEKEVYNLIATLAIIKQKPEYELRDDWQELKRSLEKSKYKNDVETILKVLNIRGIINVYDLQVALILTDKDIYNISNDELIDGYLKKLIIPCSSFTDAYEKILKYF